MTLSRKRLIYMLPLLVLLIGGGIFWFTRTAQGVNRTWDCGGGNNSWDNDLNWSGDTEPGASDVAIFDTTCTNNVTIDKSISVAGINIAAGYSGTITQSSTYTVTVGSSHFVQAAGTFTGGSGAITVNGTFTLSAGTFTSTSGTLQFGRMITETVISLSGGTFNHNNGTVALYSNGNCGGATYTVDVMTSLTLYNIVLNMAQTCSPYYLATGAGDTIVIANNYTQNEGSLLGTWEVQGNVIIGGGIGGGDGTLTMTGTGSKTYTYSSGGTGPHLRINNAGISVSAAGGTTDFKTTIFTLMAGTFTAPSGTMTLGRNTGTSENIFTVSGGTFNHNNGTVSFVATGGCGEVIFTVDVMTSLTLYNVMTNIPNGCSFFSLATGAGDTIVVANNFTQTDGVLLGTWEVQGNITIGSGADGGLATITMTGTGSKTYAYTGSGSGPFLIINNAALSLSAAGGTTDFKVANFSLVNGTFTAPSGTMTIGRGYIGSESIFTISGGTFNHNNGTVSFTAPNGGCSNTDSIVDVMTSLTLYNVITNTTPSCSGASLSTAVGDTIVAAGNFTQTDGVLLGTWEVQGNYTVATTADGGTAGITFTGGNTQIYTDQGGNEVDGDVTINKTANGVTLASNADWNAASQDLTITAGTLLQSSNYAVATGAVTVGASGKWVNNGTGAVTLGGAVANAGLIDFRSSNTCGGGDTIALHSSSNGVQRAWSGAGTFVMRDIEVKDQGGSAAITAYSSTNTSGNGANWTFSGAACPAVPTPKAGLPSGYTRLQGGKVNLR